MKTKIFSLLFLFLMGTAVFGKPQSSNLIPTPVPLVYIEGNEFYILDGLDLAQKENVWGYLINSRLFLKKSEERDIKNSTWDITKNIVESFTFNGKNGQLPPIKILVKRLYGDKEKQAIDATSKILRENGITASGCHGIFWCSDKYRTKDRAYILTLDGDDVVCDKDVTNLIRLAVIFPKR